MQNVYVMYIKISYKFHRIPDTKSRVITKVYDFLGQPSYMSTRVRSFMILLVGWLTCVLVSHLLGAMDFKLLRSVIVSFSYQIHVNFTLCGRKI